MIMVGCSLSNGTNIIEHHYTNLEPMEPLPFYEDLYNEAVECAAEDFNGQDYESINWYTATEIRAADDYRIVGASSNPRRTRIVVDSDYITNLDVVQHEILHIIMWPLGARHEDAAFVACDPAWWIYETSYNIPPRAIQ